MANPDNEKLSASSLTLADVARVAGVSAMTASRALRDAARCSATTREKVKEAARQLGYRPDPLVSIYQARIRSRRPAQYQATLGWLNDHPNPAAVRGQPVLHALRRGAEVQAEKKGFSLDEICVEMSPSTALERRVARYEGILQARGIHGLIMPGLFETKLADVCWKRTAVVKIGSSSVLDYGDEGILSWERDIYDTVSTDFFLNVVQAWSHLRGLGYRRIGFHLPDVAERWSGGEFKGAFLRMQQLCPEKEKIPICTLDLPDHYQSVAPQFQEWMNRWRPDAMICHGHLFRLLMEVCGWRISNDLGLAHLSIAEDVADWSGINPQYDKMGAIAVDLVIDLLHRSHRGIPEYPRHLHLAGGWCEGNTTKRLNEQPVSAPLTATKKGVKTRTSKEMRCAGND
jgi:LacI family transcriptional regulator